LLPLLLLLPSCHLHPAAAAAARLANEITNLSDAATLYPLFGLGANLAQALAGLVLKVCVCVWGGLDSWLCVCLGHVCCLRGGVWQGIKVGVGVGGWPGDQGGCGWVWLGEVCVVV
jgi:hypothetical protein